MCEPPCQYCERFRISLRGAEIVYSAPKRIPIPPYKGYVSLSKKDYYPSSKRMSMPPEKGLLCRRKKDGYPFSVGIVIPTMPGYSSRRRRDTYPGIVPIPILFSAGFVSYPLTLPCSARAAVLVQQVRQAERSSTALSLHQRPAFGIRPRHEGIQARVSIPTPQ